MDDTGEGPGGRMPTAAELLAMGGPLPSASRLLSATGGPSAVTPARPAPAEEAAATALRAAAEAEPGVAVRRCRIGDGEVRLDVEVPFGSPIAEVAARVRARVLAVGEVRRVDVDVVGVTGRLPTPLPPSGRGAGRAGSGTGA